VKAEAEDKETKKDAAGGHCGGLIDEDAQNACPFQVQEQTTPTFVNFGS